MRRRSNTGIIAAIVALAAAIAYIFSSIFGGFGPGEAGDGAPAVEINVTAEVQTEPTEEVETTDEGEAVEYVFEVPADGEIRYSGEPIDFARYQALVAEAAEQRATIRLVRDPAVSVTFGDQLREVIDAVDVEYVEE